jgi:hypothetical protein
MRTTADVTGGKHVAVLLQPISGLSAINPLVAFYDIHEGKREVLFFYFVPDTTQDQIIERESITFIDTKYKYLNYIFIFYIHTFIITGYFSYDTVVS